MNRNKILKVVAGSLAGMALGGALIYFNFVDKVENIEVTEEAPDFTVKTYDVVDGTFTDGETFTLSEQSKLMVINFWDTWCVPCKAEIPHFNKLQRNYPEYVEVLVLSPGRTVAWLNNSSEADGWENFELTFGHYGQNDVYAQYGFTSGLPCTAIVHDGKIVYRRQGGLLYKELKTEVLKYLPADVQSKYPDEEIVFEQKNWWKENALGVTFLAVSAATLGGAVVVSAVTTVKDKKKKIK